MSGGNQKLLGRWGEAKVADYLRNHGFQLVATNWICRYGEIDLIAENKKFIIFVEVKLRKNTLFGQGREFVDWRKQAKLRTTAEIYLATYPTELQPRFDVVEVYAPQGTDTLQPEIHYIENAF